MRYPAGNVKSAFHTARHFFRLHISLIRKPCKFESGHCVLMKLLALEAVQRSEKFNVFLSCKIWIHGYFLRYTAYYAPYFRSLLCNILTVYHHTARCHFIKGCNYIDRSGFSCSVRTYKSEYLTLIYIKAQIIYGAKIAIVLD